VKSGANTQAKRASIALSENVGLVALMDPSYSGHP
jgi:hypothetical protein